MPHASSYRSHLLVLFWLTALEVVALVAPRSILKSGFILNCNNSIWYRFLLSWDVFEVVTSPCPIFSFKHASYRSFNQTSSFYLIIFHAFNVILYLFHASRETIHAFIWVKSICFTIVSPSITSTNIRTTNALIPNVEHLTFPSQALIRFLKNCR